LGKLQERAYRSQIRDVDQPKIGPDRRVGTFPVSTRWSSIKRSGSGVHVFELAFEHSVDILNTDFRCAEVLPFTRMIT